LSKLQQQPQQQQHQQNDPINSKDHITIRVRKLDLYASVIEDATIDKVFVSYEFLRPDVQLDTATQPKANNPFFFSTLLKFSKYLNFSTVCLVY